jgi:hypothetical protein
MKKQTFAVSENIKPLLSKTYPVVEFGFDRLTKNQKIQVRRDLERHISIMTRAPEQIRVAVLHDPDAPVHTVQNMPVADVCILRPVIAVFQKRIWRETGRPDQAKYIFDRFER